MPWQIIPIWTERDELTEKYKSILSNEFNVYTFIELNNINGLQK